MKLGIKKISVTERKNISFPFFKFTESVTLPFSVPWANIPIRHLSGELEESVEIGKNGPDRTVEVHAILVDETAMNRNSLRRIERNHVFLIEDMNGVLYLVGTNHFRAVMTWKHEIDQLGKNCYSIEIKQRSPHGALKVKMPQRAAFTWPDGDTVKTVRMTLMGVVESMEPPMGSGWLDSELIYGQLQSNLGEVHASVVSEVPSWMNAGVYGSGELVGICGIFIQANRTLSERTATVVIEEDGTGNQIEMHIVQLPHRTYFSLSQIVQLDEITIQRPATLNTVSSNYWSIIFGEHYQYDVVPNIDGLKRRIAALASTLPEWILVRFEQGYEAYHNDKDYLTMTITCLENTGAERSFDIVIRQGMEGGIDRYLTIKVIQAAG